LLGRRTAAVGRLSDRFVLGSELTEAQVSARSPPGRNPPHLAEPGQAPEGAPPCLSDGPCIQLKTSLL
jgi:hypothetical protein